MLCFVATFSMIGYWTHEYFRNEDLTVIHFDSFNHSHQTYPVLSVCFGPPFLEHKLKSLNISSSSYKDYLKGDSYDNRRKNVDYENITIDIRTYITKYHIYWKNGSNYHQTNSDTIEFVKVGISYSGFSNGVLRKCFSFEIKQDLVKNVKKIKVMLNSSLFDQYPEKKRPSDGQFSTRIHHPNQFLLAYQNVKWGWPERTNNRSYYMRFTIKMVELLRRRKKSNSPCVSENNSFDSGIIKRALAKARCRPPYLIQDTSVPKCSTKEEIKAAFFDESNFEAENISPPCEEMLHLAVDYTEVDTTLSAQSVLGFTPNEILLGVIFPNRVKVIEQAREISFHSLVGNCGGYIGLFLGIGKHLF